MRFTSIQVFQFRNLAPATIPVDRRQVLLVGKNGQGKSNLLEALYMACYGSSFRTQNLRDIPLQGTQECKVHARWENEDGLPHDVEVVLKRGKRTIRNDGKQVNDRKQLLYQLPCIVFSHNDITIVSGDPESRRRFFDQTMSMYDPLFLDNLRHYKMILKQRNQAIKDGKTDLLGVYDQQLADYGLSIRQDRSRTVEEFNTLFPDLYAQVSGEKDPVRLAYDPSWKTDDRDGVLEELSRFRERDMVLQTTTSGVHRDRFLVLRGDSLLVDVGSTGQIRLASLLFRVAQMRFYALKTQRKPIILVDDVLLELDHEKRARFLATIGAYSQAFFTFLPEESYFASVDASDALVYAVEQGAFVNHAAS